MDPIILPTTVSDGKRCNRLKMSRKMLARTGVHCPSRLSWETGVELVN
jgi:hypothetical protein